MKTLRSSQAMAMPASSALPSMVAAYLHRRGLPRTLSAFLSEARTDFSEDQELVDLETLYNNYASNQMGFKEPMDKTSSDKGKKRKKNQADDGNKEESREELMLREMLHGNEKASRVKTHQINSIGDRELENQEQGCVLRDKKTSRKPRKENKLQTEEGSAMKQSRGGTILESFDSQMRGWLVDSQENKEEQNGDLSFEKGKKANDGEYMEECRQEIFTLERTFEGKQKRALGDKGKKLNANELIQYEMQEQEAVLTEKKASRRNRKENRHQTEDGITTRNQPQTDKTSESVDRKARDWMGDTQEGSVERRGKPSFERGKEGKKNESDDEENKEETRPKEPFTAEMMIKEKVENASSGQWKKMNSNKVKEYAIKEQEHKLKDMNIPRKGGKGNKLQSEDGTEIMNQSLRDTAPGMVDSKKKDRRVDSQEEKVDSQEEKEPKDKKRKKIRSDKRNKEESMVGEDLYSAQEIIDKEKKGAASQGKGHDDSERKRILKIQEQDYVSKKKHYSGVMKEERYKEGTISMAQENTSKMGVEGKFLKVKMDLEDSMKQLHEESNAAVMPSEEGDTLRVERKSKDKRRKGGVRVEHELKSIMDQEYELKDKQSSAGKKKRKDSKYEVEENIQQKHQADETTAPEKSVEEKEEKKGTDESMPSVDRFRAAVVGLPRQVLLSKKKQKKLQEEEKNNGDRLDEAKSIDANVRFFEADYGDQLKDIQPESKGDHGRNDGSEEQTKWEEKEEIKPVVEVITSTNPVAEKRTTKVVNIVRQNGKPTSIQPFVLDVLASPKELSANKEDTTNTFLGSKKENVDRNAEANYGSIEDPTSEVGIERNDGKSLGDRNPSGTLSFRRVDPSKVEFTDPRLKNNSYWAMDKHGQGWGAKAQEVLGQVRGKGFRHEKTKKKRGTYTGGAIDLQPHSIKFSYSDDEE